MSDSPLNAALNRNWIKASAEHERLDRENADLRSTNAALTTILNLCTEGTEITYGQVPDLIADLRAKLEAARKDAKFRPDPRTLWVVWFEDAAVRPEVFFGDGAEEAARAFYKQKLASWSCHLLGRIPDAAIAQGKGEK